MESSHQEAPRLPVIAIPSSLDEDFRQRLLGLKNAQIVEQANHSYVDVGENTLVHLLDARDLQPGIQDRSLVAVLTDMAKRCEYPVLLIAGNLYGKPPVDVSRSRSIAGFITCTLAVTIMGVLLFDRSPLLWLVAGMVINVSAQFGDFFESALKRVYGIKDSSQLLPGHGGVLDRIDSLLFALPAYTLLHYLFGLGIIKI